LGCEYQKAYEQQQRKYLEKKAAKLSLQFVPRVGERPLCAACWTGKYRFFHRPPPAQPFFPVPERCPRAGSLGRNVGL